jgi:genome maintenance exonuclease 1
MMKKYNYIPVDLNLPPLSLVEGEEGRTYLTPSGKRLPSVTTVTGFEGKEGFDIWRRKNPRESIRVLDRGNKLHSMMEHLLKNEDVELTEDMEINSLFTMTKNHVEHCIDNVYALEKQMWSETIGLAGRADCICDYNGKLSIVDFKGSNKEKTESGIKNYFQQATAYALMYHEISGNKVEQIVVLAACETGVLQEFIKKPIDYVDGLLKSIQLYKQWYELKPSTTTLFS